MISSTSVQQRPSPSTPRKNDTTTLSTPKASNATPQKVPPFKSNNNNNNGNHPIKVATPATASSSTPTPASAKATTTTTVQRITTSKHEEFKNQLVHDVFGRDNKGRVPMEKVAMLIWQFRTDPAVVQFMAQFVAKVCPSRNQFLAPFRLCGAWGVL